MIQQYVLFYQASAATRQCPLEGWPRHGTARHGMPPTGPRHVHVARPRAGRANVHMYSGKVLNVLCLKEQTISTCVIVQLQLLV